MEKITLSTRNDIAQLYRNCLCRDFPANELKPLEKLLELVEQKLCDCVIWQDEGAIAAYGIVCKGTQSSSALFEYFAVHPERRGQGVGSACLRELLRANERLLYFEVESPEQAKNQEQARYRKKRLAFYQLNGLAEAPFQVALYGEVFRILYAGPSLLQPHGQDLLALYQEILTPEILKSCRLLEQSPDEYKDESREE